MAKILLQDLSPKDFDRLVDEFLSVHGETLPAMREHLSRWGKPFQEMIQAYFERTDNVRYDNLTKRMEYLATNLRSYTAELKGQEKKAFLHFWNKIAEIVKTDYMQLQDQYLKNSCNYFISEISKLS